MDLIEIFLDHGVDIEALDNVIDIPLIYNRIRPYFFPLLGLENTIALGMSYW